jgi:hypothetical protein
MGYSAEVLFALSVMAARLSGTPKPLFFCSRSSKLFKLRNNSCSYSAKLKAVEKQFSKKQSALALRYATSNSAKVDAAHPSNCGWWLMPLFSQWFFGFSP